MLTSYTFYYHDDDRSQTMPIIGALVYMDDIDRYGQIIGVNRNDQTYAIGVIEEDEFMHSRHPEFDDRYDIEHRSGNEFDICVGCGCIEYEVSDGLVCREMGYQWANGRFVEEM